MSDMNKTIKKLEEEIVFHRDLYYQGIPKISDEQFDELEDKLKKIDPQNPVLKLVGSIKSSNKVAHKSKMLSLEKTYSLKDLTDWIDDKPVISMYKIDGSSCSLIYENHKLVMAKTRGDGSFGEDITAKVIWMNCIPKTIDISFLVEIRGEIYCREEEFLNLSNEMENYKLDRPSSQRNIVAGLLGRKDHINLCKHLSFMSFDVLAEHGKFNFEHEKFDWLSKNKFVIPEYVLHKNQKGLDSIIEDARDFLINGNFLIDGIVFSYDDLKLHDQLGETSHHPRYKLAFKFAGETKTTVIHSIEWGVSRNGILTPVAIVNPVELSGAKITNVTLHNLGLVKAFNLKPGDEIEIIRSGEVIPKFLKVVKSSKTNLIIPKICPSCNLDLAEEEIRLICKNKHCPDKIKAEILNFISKIGIEDLSDKRLSEMISKNLVKDIPSLYQLSIKDLLTLDKTKETLAQKIFFNISKSKKTSLITFLSSLGISGGAYNRCEKIINHGFNNLDKIFSLTEDDLLKIEGFAEKSSHDFIHSLKMKFPLIKKLKELGFEFVEKKLESNKLNNEKICITGELSTKRSEIEKIIKDNGGVVVSSVSSNTTYLLTNETDSTSSKFKKAKELGIKIISENEFLKKL